MIKETCSCGASIEINHGSMAGVEQDNVERWRENHKHETKSAYIPPWNQRYNSGTASTVLDPETFTLNEDYVYNGDGVPVWIADRVKPTIFNQWAEHWTKP